MTDMTADELSYALAKQVPDIAGTRAVFGTNYGSLILDHDDSVKVAALVEKLLRKKEAKMAKRRASNQNEG